MSQCLALVVGSHHMAVLHEDRIVIREGLRRMVVFFSILVAWLVRDVGGRSGPLHKSRLPWLLRCGDEALHSES
jgi:hypothetical protein